MNRREIVEILHDDGALEEHLAIDQQKRHLAQRRQLEEPFRLAREVDADALECQASLGKRNGHALRNKQS